MTFGEKLRYLRMRQGLTIPELSEASGLARSHIQYLEKDMTPPTDRARRLLEAALNLDPNELEPDG